MTEFIRYDVTDGLATITIDRPAKRNALSWAMYHALRRHLVEAETDPAVTAIIITGVPEQFCAGTDLTDLDRPGAAKEASGDKGAPREDDHWFVVDCTKPVITAVDGPAAGLGVEIATQSDFRIASTRARFSWIFVQRGLIPDTGAGTWLLPQQIGQQQAKRLVFSGEFISAQEAHRIGFVLDVVEPEDLPTAARELARKVSTGSPFAVREAKALIDAAGSRTRSEHLKAHDVAVQRCRESDDHKEGVRAFLEKRPAVFTGT
ncbi:enoyl-CoA hydratase/isomerase family protein [Specibacter sp. RAF43]|uniref:enoyl-CoA hydratase/isomerase family protein n=1 Tax=Specibacter sp. RAF43 TaxID=3233057 RepID=UPI003F9ACEC9